MLLLTYCMFPSTGLVQHVAIYGPFLIPNCFYLHHPFTGFGKVLPKCSSPIEHLQVASFQISYGRQVLLLLFFLSIACTLTLISVALQWSRIHGLAHVEKLAFASMLTIHGRKAGEEADMDEYFISV